MKLGRLILLALLVLTIGTGSAVYWAIGTENGTRWLLARAASFLPAQLAIGATRGALLDTVTVTSLQWRDETIDVSVQQLQVELELLPLITRQVMIRSLQVEDIDVDVQPGDGEPAEAVLPHIELPIAIALDNAELHRLAIRLGDDAYEAERLAIAASWRGSRLRIGRLELDSDWLDLQLDGTALFAGERPVDLNATWRWIQSEELAFGGKLRLTGKNERFSVEHELTAPLRVYSRGEIGLGSDGPSLDLAHEWSELRWETPSLRLRSPGGSLRTRGKPQSLALELNSRLQLDEWPLTDVELHGDVTTGTLSVGELRVEELRAGNELGQLEAAGELQWQPDTRIEMSYRLTKLDPSRFVETLSGQVEVAGTVAATVGERGPEVDLGVAELGGVLRELPLQGGGRLRYTEDSITVSDARLQLGANSVSGHARSGETLDVEVQLTVPELGQLLTDASGSLHGTLAMQGTRDRPAVRADIRGEALNWQGNTIDDAVVSVNGRLDDHRLAASVNGLDTKLELQASGGYESGAWRGELDGIAISRAEFGRWATREASRLEIAGSDVALGATCLFGPDDGGEICFGAKLGPDGAATIDATAFGVPLAALPLAPPRGMQVSGRINAGLSLERAGEQLNGEANLSLVDATITAEYDEEPLSLTLDTAAAQATLVGNRVATQISLELDGGAGTSQLDIAIEDFRDKASGLSGQGELSIQDAGFVALFIPEISRPKGRIEGVMTVSGSLLAPDLRGEIHLSEGAFFVRQAGVSIEDFDILLARQGPGELRLTGKARSGDGNIAVEGRALLGADTGMRTELALRGDDFELLRLPDWRLSASPDLTAVFDEQEVLVRGELLIPAADIRVKELPQSAQSPSPDAIVHRPGAAPPTARRRIDIDVRAALGDDVRLEGFGLKTGLQGAVQVHGGSHAPYTGQGRLSLHGGRYKAYGQDLDIERGELVFSGALDNPQLDIRAVRRAGTVTAGIELTGTPARLRSEVFSEPPLSDAEALSYLLTGRSLASATSAGEGDTLNNAAFALGLSGAGVVASQVRSSLGLDTLAFEGGASDGRLIAGKRFGDRLLVEYGYGLVDKLGTLLLRYELNERIILESRTGTVSNLDIVYRVRKQ